MATGPASGVVLLLPVGLLVVAAGCGFEWPREEPAEAARRREGVSEERLGPCTSPLLSPAFCKGGLHLAYVMRKGAKQLSGQWGLAG